jgi:hypothetical protein
MFRILIGLAAVALIATPGVAACKLNDINAIACYDPGAAAIIFDRIGFDAEYAQRRNVKILMERAGCARMNGPWVAGEYDIVAHAYYEVPTAGRMATVANVEVVGKSTPTATSFYISNEYLSGECTYKPINAAPPPTPITPYKPDETEPSAPSHPFLRTSPADSPDGFDAAIGR